MGGCAFKDYTVPRLSHESYNKLQAQIEEKLRNLFENVATPAHDPAKQDHGDIDFIVHTPLVQDVFDRIRAVLRSIEELPGRPTTNYLLAFEESYAQIDIHVCEKENWEMQVFLHSYGRMGIILPKMLLRFELYLDKRGLFTNKPLPAKPGFLLLKTVSEVLKFANLSEERYKAGFASREEVFQWLETGSVVGIPLIKGWRGSKITENDGMVWEWHLRRQNDERIDLDKDAIRESALAELGLTGKYQAWQAEVREKARLEDIAKARAAAISAEITRRMALSPARGRERAEAAKVIRAEVEDEWALKNLDLEDAQ